MKSNAALYGMLAGLGLLLFYLGIVSFFQGIEFALLNLKSLWYLIFPLAAALGIQIGIYSSIKHTAMTNATAGVSGGVSGGSMIACCSHFLLNVIPLIGASGIAVFLTAYQKWFLGFGISVNLVGIGILWKHKKRMEGKCDG